LLRLLKDARAFRDGAWSLIDPLSAWSGNWTSNDIVACAWAHEDGSRYLVVVNYAGNQGQCRVRLPFPEFRGKQVRLIDAIGAEAYDRECSDLVDNGLFIDHGPWRFNVFEIETK
jgi:hypothetical protein